MAPSTGSIYEVRWNELCPWLVLTKALRVSLLARVLAYAWLGLLLTQWGWRACESLWGEPAISGTSSEQTDFTTFDTRAPRADLREIKAAERRLMASSLFRSDPPSETDPQQAGNIIVHIIEARPFAWLRDHWKDHSYGPLVEGWQGLSLPFVKIFRLTTSLSEILQLLCCGLWAIAVWGITGGAIARTAARYCAREEIISPLAAGRAAITKWPSTTGSPLITLVFAVALVLPLALLGLVMRADLLAVVAGIFWVLALAWGLGIAVVLIAVWFGWPLMWATIAVERSDAFDAASRTAAYVYQRPLRLAFYVAVATVLGIFGQLVVSGFASAGNHLTEWAVSWGSGAERIAELAMPINDGVEPTFAGSAALASQAIDVWKHMLATVAAAYPLAYLFSASVGIYLLLRLHVDSTEMDEISADADEDALPQEPRIDDAPAAPID